MIRGGKLSEVNGNRLEHFDRDVKRWEYMEEQERIAKRMIEVQKLKNFTGLQTHSSKPYDIINQDYQRGRVGEQF